MPLEKYCATLTAKKLAHYPQQSLSTLKPTVRSTHCRRRIFRVMDTNERARSRLCGPSRGPLSSSATNHDRSLLLLTDLEAEGAAPPSALPPPRSLATSGSSPNPIPSETAPPPPRPPPRRPGPGGGMTTPNAAPMCARVSRPDMRRRCHGHRARAGWDCASTY